MMKRISSLLMITLLAVVLTACSVNPPSTVTPPTIKPVMGDITLTGVYLTSADVAKIGDSKISEWYQREYQRPGLHSMSSGKDQYLLISAGEQPTSGYFIDDIRVTGEEKGLRVTAKLYGPDKEAVVAQVITYPHVLVKIAADQRALIFNLDQFKQVVTYQTESGRLVKKLSADCVEIKISGTPEAVPGTTYKLAQSLQVRFDGLGITKNDDLRFVYVTTADNQKLIIDMVKIGPVAGQVSTGMGKYVGQIDASSVEIFVNGQSQAFRLSEELKTKIESLGLMKDDAVTFEFTTNEHKQYVLTKLIKAGK